MLLNNPVEKSLLGPVALVTVSAPSVPAVIAVAVGNMSRVLAILYIDTVYRGMPPPTGAFDHIQRSHATWRTGPLFPLNSRRRLAGYVVYDAVNAAYFIDDTIGNFAQ